ncbi:MAG: transcription-repair coupling factor, partial [Elusimicrobiota bacterium]
EYCRFKTGYVFDGFAHSPSKKAVITSSEIFKRRYHLDVKDLKIKTKRFKLSDLNIGDFIVHEDFGIGKYLGIKKARNRIGETESFEETDCLNIEYAKGDKLLVPFYEFARVQKYISSQGKAPKLSYMDSKTWSEVKNRVREEVQTLAKEILRIEAERLVLDIAPMNEENYLEREFADSFPFEETPDQTAAIEDVLSDMSMPKTMNRLLVGDVGFGKTEVAMRSAMRCILSGKQAAMLAPTTILADQHFRTFTDRFRGFPVNISVISRFETRTTQKKILENLANGVVDIVIGTHRLLQNDVKFKSLGLLIIDEEHRFGVRDKEKLKIMAKGVHVLMLSATPIPRTLYQSLSSLKSMSVIESPPIGRLPIATVVKPFDEKTAAGAINFELSRNGQVYYVHNRVQTIKSKMQFLKKLVPDARICIVHGQMKSVEIERHMWDFLNKKYEILLASTIIESGLDIPSVNTLIVENAHELGLAQLYQLRGRIGREKQKAYCYLFYPSWLKPHPTSEVGEVGQENISENAVRRMAALQEFTELGSGFRLAMRDLEIRGAGELLGTRQHGFINSVGLEFYVKLLNNEINKLHGKKEELHEEVNIDLKIPAFISEDYINDDMERLNFYKKLLNAPVENIEKIINELEDISGPAPEPLKNLAEVLKLRKTLSKYSVRAIVQKENSIEIFFNQKSPITPEVINKWHRQYRDSIIFLPSKSGDGIRLTKTETPLKTISEIMNSLKPEQQSP